MCVKRYDVFDHNDQAKSHVNWSVLDESSYEVPWFPVGPCDPAVKLSAPGSVIKQVVDGGDMQSFSFEQLIKDAQVAAAPAPSHPTPPMPPPATSDASAFPAETVAPLSDTEKIFPALYTLVSQHQVLPSVRYVSVCLYCLYSFH